MSGNSLLTAQWVARKSLIKLHAKSNMAARTNRNYQDQFTPLQGVPRGTTVNVRMPFRYKGRTGQKMSAENSVQRYVPLSLSNQNGVDINFSSVERAMDLGDFEEQVLEPAMAQVSALIESNIAALTSQFPKMLGAYNTTITFGTVTGARRFLTEALAPEDDNRTLTACPQHHEDFVNANAALFNPETSISDQFIEGVIAERVAGFTAFENTKVPGYTFGTTAGSTPTVSGAGQGNSGAGNAYVSTTSLVTSGWASGETTLNAGDVFTISGVYDVDPETKQSLQRLKQFVVTEQVSDTTGDITAVISPAIITGGAYQNVSAAPAAAAAITVAGNSGSSVKQSLGWHKDAILFACVPMLDLSNTVKMCASESFEGFYLRFAQVYDVDNDLLPGRIDTLSGEVIGYNELGVRLIGQATSS